LKNDKFNIPKPGKPRKNSQRKEEEKGLKRVVPPVAKKLKYVGQNWPGLQAP
jgi:hypothetical protein